MANDKKAKDVKRCTWCGDDPLYMDYHDKEWGLPVHDDTKLFEMLILEGAQAGLSWITILKRRDGYRKAFDNFDAVKIAKYDQKRIDALLADTGIIRNKLKVNAAIKNAKVFLKLQAEYGSFDAYIWQFVKHKPIQNKWTASEQVPAETVESQAMSKALKKLGFSFVGPTICYAYMQATGMVNDHLKTCYRYKEIVDLAK